MHTPGALSCSLSTNRHRCFITRHKRGHKTNWTKTHSTHDLTHASQSVLSLKSQRGVFETISIRSLGFVSVTTSVVKTDLVKELRQDEGPRYQGYWTMLLMSSNYTTWSAQGSHTSNTSRHLGCGWDCAPDLVHTSVIREIVPSACHGVY